MATSSLIKTTLNNAVADGIYTELTEGYAKYYYFLGRTLTWEDELNPQWEECFEFRIKPEKEPDIVRVFGFRTPDGKPYELELLKQSGHITGKCLKVVWDGTTGELKSAEVLK